MEEKNPDVDDPRQTLRPTGGRDELNLAEFPITLLSDRVPKGCKTLVFEIEPRKGDTAGRKVEITGGDAYGLPTALDDEILVALIQLTKLKNEFKEPTVAFSRYEILKLLGWQDDGRSYNRVKESIMRWTGVTLYYHNAWRDNESGRWVTENFHIIERSSFMDPETRRFRKNRGQEELAFSSFTWNPVIFQSFQAGSLKRLDVDAYFSYSTSIAKRMYRFLDKRFWIKDHWEFDLKEFAFQHIGLSSNYNVAQLKNKLEPALKELSESTEERDAFLEPMEPQERYQKLGKGRWIIKLSRKHSPPALPDVEVPEPSGLVLELVNRGVTSAVATELVNSSPAELIIERIEVFDWLSQKQNQKAIKDSPTGYLVTSIRDRWISKPKGFKSKADREKQEEAAKKAQIAEHESRAREEADRVRRAAEAEHIARHWEGLTPEEQAKLELDALEQGEPSLAENARKKGPAFEHVARMSLRLLRDAHIRNLLGLEPEGTSV